MNTFLVALRVEILKACRSKAILFSFLIFILFPLACGLFMVILKDPQAAQSMGIISMKAQIVAGTAEWSAFFDMLRQVIGMAGYIFFAFITTWIFGREFSDRTAKDLLALPTSRASIIGAKFMLTFLWVLGLTLIVFLVGLIVGASVDIPGWSTGLAAQAFRSLFSIALLSYLLMPFVALFASLGHGYLPALGWAFGSFITAQIISVLGWGDWLPWSVPALLSGMFGPQGVSQLGIHSYLLVCMAFSIGVLATLSWWQFADHTH